MRCLWKDDDDDDLTMCWSQNAGVTVSIVSTVRPSHPASRISVPQEAVGFVTGRPESKTRCWKRCIICTLYTFSDSQQDFSNLVVLQPLTNVTKNPFRAGNFLRTIEEEWPGTLDSFEKKTRFSN